MAAHRVLNILLMGETGHGKSTLINSFYNYQTFKTFNDALNGPERCLIQTKFIVRDDDFKSVTIMAGKTDRNECIECGQSATMATKSYLFPPIDGTQMRLIDSSGFAATQGPVQDAETVRDIINYISHYEVLNAIAIVVKGHESRLTAEFEYCIQQVLTHLHMSAVKNLVFVFTHGPKAGDSVDTMMAIFKKINITTAAPQINLNRKNCYFFENDAFRSLMAAHKGISLTSSDRKQADYNWETASEEFRRFLSYLKNLTPHDVTATVNMNKVRIFAEAFSLIVGEILSNIETNKRDIEMKMKDLQCADTVVSNFDEESLSSTKVQDIRMDQLKDPNVVCTSEKCCETYQLPDGRKKRHYTHLCCEACNNRIWPLNLCTAFAYPSGYCTKCGCHVNYHERTYYKTVVCTAQEVNKDQAAKLANAQSDRERKEVALKTNEDYLRKLETEKDVIQKAIAKFSTFIKTHAILAYNSRADDYSKTREETQHVLSRDEHTAQRLDSALDPYMKQSGHAPVSLGEIQTIKKQLLQLEIYGPKINSVSQETKKAKRAVNREVVV